MQRGLGPEIQMRRAVPIIALIATLAVPSMGFAAPLPAPRAGEPANERADDRVVSHAVRGVVKSVTVSSLVVSRPGRSRGGDLTFVLTPSTDRDGTLVAGATISVR